MMNGLHTVLPAADLERARAYYHDKLGLDPDQTRPGSMMFHLASGSAFEIYETPNAGTAQNTQMGWMTDDLEGEMAAMRSRGVVFEEYESTVNGIFANEDGRAAWFRDSEGNFICLSETA